MLGEAVDPSELPSPQQAQDDEDRAVAQESAPSVLNNADGDNEDVASQVGDDMSVASGVNPEAEQMLYELTADPVRARSLAKWEVGVTKQWAGKRWSDGVTVMNDQLGERDVHSHVSEVYSPPRVTGLCASLGLLPGMALDLSSVDPDDGKTWDFNDPERGARI